MDDHRVEHWVVWLLVIIGAAAFGVLIAMVAGCATTQADIQKVASSQSAVTALKIAACVQGALAEEQLEQLRQRREQEAEAELEADRLRSEMRVPSSISQEVDKVVRGDAGVM
jgi:ABC-type uncharacterized transport system permease subunit